MANAFHCATKTYILRRAMGAEVDWQSFCLRYFSADGTAKVTGSRTAIRYPDLSPAENDFCVVDTSIALSKDRLCGTTQTK